MQVEFDKKICRYLQRISGEMQSQEQTQELRLTEGMPDIGNVLGAWGQVLIRSKEWQQDTMSISGGVMVWALYVPEDGSAPQKVEGWLPFQMKWPLPESSRDGVILAVPYLRSVDARSISARKVILRCVVEVQAEAYIPAEAQVCVPGQMPEALQLLIQHHDVILPKEAGEKPFEISEVLHLPASAPQLQEVIRFEVRPEIIDRKVMTDKGIFRGSLALHVVYCDDQGQFSGWDFDVPFSQFTQLDAEFAEDAQVQIFPAVTSLEVEPVPDGGLSVNAGMTCQYLVYDKEELSLVADVFSLQNAVEVDAGLLELPVVSGWEEKTVSVQQQLEVPAQKMVDVTFLPAAPRQLRQPGGMDLELTGQMQALFYDAGQKLSVAGVGWNETMPLSRQEVHCVSAPTGTPQGNLSGGQLQLSANLYLQNRILTQEAFPMITGVELGEAIEPDPGRPSLIIRRAGTDSLWQMAKTHGTTVERIRSANHLEDTPAPGQMLLIPIP